MQLYTSFTNCLFFYARKVYVGTHVKITQQWKSTLNASVNSSCALRSVPAVPGVGHLQILQILTRVMLNADDNENGFKANRCN